MKIKKGNKIIDVDIELFNFWEVNCVSINVKERNNFDIHGHRNLLYCADINYFEAKNIYVKLGQILYELEQMDKEIKEYEKNNQAEIDF